MKLSVHTKTQWDHDDAGVDTLVAAHLSTPNASTRVLFVGRYRRTGIYLIEFGGRFVRERLEQAFREAFA